MTSQAKIARLRKAGQASAASRYANGGRPDGPIARLPCEQGAANRLRAWARAQKMATSAALTVAINGYLDRQQ